jgi:hypothetical protein
MVIEEKKFPYPCIWDSGNLVGTERKPMVVVVVVVVVEMDLWIA